MLALLSSSQQPGRWTGGTVDDAGSGLSTSAASDDSSEQRPAAPSAPAPSPATRAQGALPAAPLSAPYLALDDAGLDILLPYDPDSEPEDKRALALPHRPQPAALLPLSGRDAFAVTRSAQSASTQLRPHSMPATGSSPLVSHAGLLQPLPAPAPARAPARAPAAALPALDWDSDSGSGSPALGYPALPAPLSSPAGCVFRGSMSSPAGELDSYCKLSFLQSHLGVPCVLLGAGHDQQLGGYELEGRWELQQGSGAAAFKLTLLFTKQYTEGAAAAVRLKCRGSTYTARPDEMLIRGTWKRMDKLLLQDAAAAPSADSSSMPASLPMGLSSSGLHSLLQPALGSAAAADQQAYSFKLSPVL